MTPSSPRPFSFDHPAFTKAEPGISFFSAERCTVLAIDGQTASAHQICQVIFGRSNGALFVQFPYFPRPEGVVASLDIVIAPDKTSRFDLGQFGKVTSHLVKYSHPPDGDAHFSQDRKVFTLVRRRTMPLSAQGHVFELHAFLPSGFKTLAPGGERPGRLYAPFAFEDGLPAALSVTGEWRLKDRVRADLARMGSPTDPVTRLPRRSDGKLFLAMLLAPPPSSPFFDHILAINMGPAPAIPQVTTTSMIFMGGWEERPGQAIPAGCLTFLYPDLTPEETRRRLGSIDYSPRGSAASAG